MNPLISVVMAVRDGASWLAQAIQSISIQTLPDFELIIVDDGSIENSPQIARAASWHDPRIRLIYQERLGLVAALNRGLQQVRGQLIARLDADDRAHPERFQKQSDYLEHHPEVGLVGTWAERIDDRGALAGFIKPPTESKALRSLLTRTNPFLHSSVMFRKDIMQKVGLYRPAFEAAEDYDLWFRMSEIADIANLPEYLVQYRFHRASVTNSSPARQLFSSRLAQRAARARRTTGRDPTSTLAAPPDWNAPEAQNSILYGDLVRLFRFLDSAESLLSNDGHIDLSVINNCGINLSHAERRMAQLALTSVLKGGAALSMKDRLNVLWNLVRLHPPRAAQLALQSLRNAR